MKNDMRLHWFIRLSSFLLAAAVLWLFVGFLLPHLLPVDKISNTQKSGIIFRREEWSGEIKIKGDIWALPGTTVSVQPGSKILVSKEGDSFNLHWLPWELRSGLNTGVTSLGIRNGELFYDERQKIQIHLAKFFVWGTKEQPVELMSEESRPGSPYDFNVIEMDEGILSNIKMANYRKFLIGDKTTIRESEFRTTGECAVCIYFGKPVILKNHFEDSVRSSILVVRGNPKINDNLFSGIGEGIIVDPKRFGMPIIYHNNFEGTGTALRFLTGGEEVGGAVALNDFAGPSAIDIPCDSKVKFVQNQIRGLFRFAPSSNCSGSISLGPNYWQTTDKHAILREKIVGREARFEVLLPSVLQMAPHDVGRRID